jgi:DNA-binding XRE family transcriptional regulator
MLTPARITAMLTPSRHCSCGRGFVHLTVLESHLDDYGDDSDAHVEVTWTRSQLLAYGMRRVRIEHGLTMIEMADAIGVHVSTISRIEAGRRGVTRWRPEHVAADLGVSVEELLRLCHECAYVPQSGYQCLSCGTCGSAPQI